VQYELFVGLRYTRAKRSNHFISFISLISMFGIALGVAALIVVLSVMNGFQKELRARILSVVSHVQISGPGGQLADWPKLVEEASRNPQVVAAAPFVDAQAMLSSGPEARGALVRGVEPALEQQVADIGAHMTVGKLDELAPGELRIVLGVELARALGVGRGDRITLMMPRGSIAEGALPALRQLVVSGVFDLGMFEYDSTLALVHLKDAQDLYGLGDRVSGVRLKLADLLQSRSVAQDLLWRIDPRLFITDWTRSHANFFRAVQSQKTMMFIILLLIVAVAAFNIVATLVMVVTDKQADIAILRTLGASPAGIMKVFIVQGTLIGVIGTLIGVVGGILLALNVGVVLPLVERLLGVRVLDPSVYFISQLPSDLQRADVVAIALVALVLSLFATLYPSWRASRLSPAEALRYE
jgi:lipoprotein-releasing system permease protein